MVNIYLSGYQSPFLSVPNDDVERLSNRPFPWLRYVMFSICGARGHLFHTPDASGDPVDYDTSLANLPDSIYYKTSGDCIFVDYQCFSDQLTSTTQTSRRKAFRSTVLDRDGYCVITYEKEYVCDAAHLISRCKGDKYIDRVVRERSPLYDLQPSITGINDGQNGILLRKDLHSSLSRGAVAFLKTPNYGLEPTDIKRVNSGPARTDYITLQRLEKPNGYNPTLLANFVEMAAEWDSRLANAGFFALGGHLDVQFRGSPAPRTLRPPDLILDYAYGIAAYKCWHSRQDGDQVHPEMEKYRSSHYNDFPLPQQSDDDFDAAFTSEGNSDDSYHPQDQDDAHGPDHPPYMSLRRGDFMAAAMDELNLVLMSIRGITPKQAAIRREKKMEEEELRAQEASRSKVMEWMSTTAGS